LASFWGFLEGFTAPPSVWLCLGLPGPAVGLCLVPLGWRRVSAGRHLTDKKAQLALAVEAGELWIEDLGRLSAARTIREPRSTQKFSTLCHTSKRLQMLLMLAKASTHKSGQASCLRQTSPRSQMFEPGLPQTLAADEK